ncbi:cytoplasmic 60S subunit biogenesis factor ZNF622 [Tribolium castaneum]|uniref:Zinc finger protein 622-like Protein n=1 Tax=Tribolium castaneum TaxID=7070 RepID=D2A0Y5_TRICA|nr:PREDICTED: zinc finger protein 622 [Tribolium castaneum]EFA01610.1 Zinc finger protein 622-like Protein [Tribolium castaneum]|eukprot:XP_973525.1 PREDICTED: zinc finger protein 622 [Tribolium castaneum]
MEKSDVSLNSFTCITCHVAFKNAELQREHYKSDWHRYNLKRKVSELPPVSAEDFQRKVFMQRSVEEEKKQDKSVHCQICRKLFGNQNAYDNHLNSKKHKENEKDYVEVDSKPAKESDSDIEEVDSDEWDEESENPLDNNDCIFCLHHSKNFLKNLEHMTVAHSFFIPDVEYCTDVYGLLQYLGEKISNGFMCLWCNEKGRTFYSADAARKHMLDKGHCRMLHEGVALAEYADFYDYSTSYPDAESHTNPDEEVAIPELDSTEYQLVLPSGVSIGHRSLMRYYKQNIGHNSAIVSKPSKLHKVLSCYRALGWTETQQEAAAKKARDIHYLKRMQAKFNLSLGIKGNKLQKHVRPQVNF